MMLNAVAYITSTAGIMEPIAAQALTASSSTNAGVMPAAMHCMCLSGMHSISLAATTAFALMTAFSLRSSDTCNNHTRML